MKGRWRRMPLVLAALLVLLLGLTAAVLTAAVLFAVTIDGTRWRDVAAQRMSAALGRPVVLQGALGLTLGRELVLKSDGLRVLNPPGFSGPEFLAADQVRVRIGLLDALRGRLHLRAIEASDVRLALEQAADGRSNWAFPPSTGSSSASAGFDLGLVMLRGLSISHFDARSAARRSLDLDELTASVGSDVALQLTLQGRAGLQRVVKLSLDGGPLALLREGSQPWPFELAFKGAGAWLQARGHVDAGQARFDFESGADENAPLGLLLGTALPQAGAAALQGAVVLTSDTASITNLRGRLGESGISGQLALTFGGARPRLSGALDIDAFDLRSFFGEDLGAAGESPQVGKSTRPDLLLRDLTAFDVAVDLSVGHWPGLPVDLRNTRFELRAGSRGLHIPINASVAGVPVAGLLELDTAPATPLLALRLDAKDVAPGTLAEASAAESATESVAASAIRGRLGSVSLRVGGSGDTLGSLWRDLALSLAVADVQASVANPAGTLPIAFTLSTLDLTLRPGERLRGSARGTLLGERATLSLRSGTLKEWLHGPLLPFEVELVAAPARLRLDGLLARHGESGDSGIRPDTTLNFAFSAVRSGDLARWLGVAPESKLPVALNGRLDLAGDSWRLAGTTLQLGRSKLTINAGRSFTGQGPLTVAAVRSPLIDLPELMTLRSGPALSLDAPLLDAAVSLPDVDLDIALDRVLLGRTELAGLGLAARIRDGHLPSISVEGRLAGAPFTGSIGLDLRGLAPEARLELATGDIDVGSLLRGLGAVEVIDGRADTLQFSLQVRGNTLRELASQAAAEARLNGGSFSLLGAARQTVADIQLGQAVIGAAAGGPVRVSLDGAWGQTPVRIELATGTLVDMARDTSRLPFTLQALAAQTRLDLEGEVALPLGSAARLNIKLAGERLDTLSELARVELPAWGPWSFRGPLSMTPDGYELRQLQLRVGDSRLGGSGRLDISGPRPRLNLHVAAPRIQLDDFPLPRRVTDAGDAGDTPPQAGSGDRLRVRVSRLAGRTEQLLSAGFLRRFDATIDVEAQEVLSGADRLADGLLHLKLQDGRLHLDPAVLNMPGGRMRLAGSYDLKGNEVEFAVGAQIERFDYGIIARRLGRADDVKGLFSLNLLLEGKAASLATIMRKANGKVDLAVWPTDLSLGVFNLWSVNLVLSVLPLIDPGGNARVNCVVGRFDLKGGMLTDDRFLIDTTRVRVSGSGQADLGSEELAFVFRPRAKGLALFRLQTPLRVSGTLTDQRFGVTQRDLVESTLRLIASPILLPIEWFVLGPLPHDGADVCTDPLRASRPAP